MLLIPVSWQSPHIHSFFPCIPAFKNPCDSWPVLVRVALRIVALSAIPCVPRINPIGPCRRMPLGIEESHGAYDYVTITLSICLLSNSFRCIMHFALLFVTPFTSLHLAACICKKKERFAPKTKRKTPQSHRSIRYSRDPR